ncbi:P-glycoprotein 9 isoform 1 [Hibiscus syriacus]|uniref:p-glycoprotein 9 isoform 1 n=1 Tax=Hibiscus syriacus TaxID=106335 RepID=A0A6A2Z9P4_HIBSY|nr:P-glycoprotein 9 isoform 1 [Hibiscus syriacus]
MPSGSKKRKAAKKKKEQAATNINSPQNIPHGNGDPRSQGERESDGGDVDSPASQDDHNHQHPFNQREEGKREHSAMQSHAAEEKYAERAIGNAENTVISGFNDVVAVKIEKESEPEENLESTLHDKSSSSSSSSSDDESKASEKKSKDEAYNFAVRNVGSNSAAGTADVDNLIKTAVSVQEEVDHATEVSANKSVLDVEPGLNGSEEKLLPSSNGVSRFENEGKISSSSVTSAESSTVVNKTQHFESHDHSEKQPVVASTPPMVQRTSVLSCCGLFDVFNDSGR